MKLVHTKKFGRRTIVIIPICLGVALTFYGIIPIFVIMHQTFRFSFGFIPIIFIKVKDKTELPFELVTHERVHISQFFSTFGLFCFLYSFSEKRRLAFEIEAYTEQLFLLIGDERKIFRLMTNHPEYMIGIIESAIFSSNIYKLEAIYESRFIRNRIAYFIEKKYYQIFC